MPADADALVLRSLPLVKYVIGRMRIRKTRAWDEEDCYQWGVIGLLDAVRRFNPSRGKFSSWAFLRIRCEIIDGMRRMDDNPRRKRGEPYDVVVPSSLDRAVNDDDDNPLNKFQVDTQAPDPEAVAIRHDEARRLAAAVTGLKPSERTALVLHYGRRRTMKATAGAMGISASRVCQLCQSGEMRLRKVLDGRS